MTPDKQLEDAVIAHLKTDISLAVLRVESYPVQPDKYRLTHARGAVLVWVGDSRYSPAVMGVCTRTATVLTTLLVRNLSNHDSGHDYRDAIRTALFGWCPENDWDDLHPSIDSYVSEKDGVWQYDLTFTVSRRHITQYNACGA